VQSHEEKEEEVFGENSERGETWPKVPSSNEREKWDIHKSRGRSLWLGEIAVGETLKGISKDTRFGYTLGGKSLGLFDSNANSPAFCLKSRGRNRLLEIQLVRITS